MIAVRKSNERGHFDYGWLNTYHTFSFNEYYDPKFMGFRSLRVINEDRVQPGTEFPTHGHRDMEIISYVIDGELSHKDSMGTGSVIRPGEVQKMSAGRGVMHSERNNADDKTTHFLQIWIIPSEKSLAPDYQQIRIDEQGRQNELLLVASPDGPDSTRVKINQDARLYTCRLDEGKTTKAVLDEGRHGWVQVISGEVSVNGQPLAAGDGAAISDEREVLMTGLQAAEFLFFDLA